MKNIKNFYFTLSSLTLLMIFTGCSDILNEEPRSILTPEFFETAQGIEGGVTAAYSSFRYYYCRHGAALLTTFGTDEYSNGNQIIGNSLNTYQGLTADNGDILTPWNRSYPAINTCNGVIELGQNATDLSEDIRTNLIAEAKFLRAEWYFILVQTFGGVSLDLGSGPLAFNRTPSSEFSRATLGETWSAIIKDLEDASNELPDVPRQEGRVWKASALHLLAKAYLSRGWSDAAENNDFEKALSTVQRLIPNATSPIANYGARLLPDFSDVHREGNANNDEVLYEVERNEDINFNERQTDKGNQANFYWRCFYVQFPGMIRDVENGRPWIRFRPTDFLLNEVFNNKTIDSRYDKSHQTVWIANNPDPTAYPIWTQDDANAGFVDASLVGEPKFGIGDTAMWMVPDYIQLNDIEKNSRGYTVLLPEEYDDGWFPSLSKYDARERPTAGTEEDPNIDSYRPFIVHRLAETYLIGAEAALMQGNNSLAADYINTVRQRAAWPGMESQMLITPGDVDIDFILDERSRELAGEMLRWFDLVRTKKLVERVQMYNIEGGANVQAYHMLRPIPQSQIDLAPGYVQNPGY